MWMLENKELHKPVFSLLWLYVNFMLIIQFFDQVSGGKSMCFKLQTSDNSHQNLVAIRTNEDAEGLSLLLPWRGSHLKTA